MKISCFALIFTLFLLVPFIASCQLKESVPLTTIILVRHAEKASEPADNPPLTAKGSARAALLRDMLTQVNVSAIYSTPYLRNTETVTPLADDKATEIIEYDPRKDPSGFLESVLSEHPGEVVVICGHSNTVPVMLNRLTGTENYQQLDETEYEDMFVATASRLGEAVIVNLNVEPAL